MPIRPEQPTQELAHQRHRATYLSTRLHARQRESRRRQLAREHDGPLALVIPGSRLALAGDPFDVVEDPLSVHRLTHHDAALPCDTDRTVAEQMPEQTREGQSAH